MSAHRPPRPEVLAFLQDIKQNPDDDAPRLILADWLDERGEEDRARFLRAQVELARRADDAPRRGELRRQERELRHRHEYTWLGPLPSLADGWKWRRGLVHLSMTG